MLYCLHSYHERALLCLPFHSMLNAKAPTVEKQTLKLWKVQEVKRLRKAHISTTFQRLAWRKILHNRRSLLFLARDKEKEEKDIRNWLRRKQHALPFASNFCWLIRNFYYLLEYILCRKEVSIQPESIQKVLFYTLWIINVEIHFIFVLDILLRSCRVEVFIFARYCFPSLFLSFASSYSERHACVWNIIRKLKTRFQ